MVEPYCLLSDFKGTVIKDFYPPIFNPPRPQIDRLKHFFRFGFNLIKNFMKDKILTKLFLKIWNFAEMRYIDFCKIFESCEGL